MTAPLLLAYNGLASVNLKSEAELRFVGAVIGSFSRRAFTLYLVGGPELRPLTAIFLSALGATGRSHGGSDDLVRTFRLPSSGTARHIDLSTTQHADDEVIAKINELIAQKVFLIVEGADRLPLPNPDFQSRAATTSTAAETARIHLLVDHQKLHDRDGGVVDMLGAAQVVVSASRLRRAASTVQ